MTDRELSTRDLADAADQSTERRTDMSDDKGADKTEPADEPLAIWRQQIHAYRGTQIAGDDDLMSTAARDQAILEYLEVGICFDPITVFEAMTARGKFNVRAQPLGHGAIGLCFGHGASPGTVIQSTVDYDGRIPHLGIGGHSARRRN